MKPFRRRPFKHPLHRIRSGLLRPNPLCTLVTQVGGYGPLLYPLVKGLFGRVYITVQTKKAALTTIGTTRRR